MNSYIFFRGHCTSPSPTVLIKFLVTYHYHFCHYYLSYIIIKQFFITKYSQPPVEVQQDHLTLQVKTRLWQSHYPLHLMFSALHRTFRKSYNHVWISLASSRRDRTSLVSSAPTSDRRATLTRPTLAQNLAPSTSCSGPFHASRVLSPAAIHSFLVTGSSRVHIPTLTA